ncbi:MAG: VanZ family protein [Sphingomonadaceae bacterium]
MPAILARLLDPRLLRALFWLLFALALVMAALPKPPHLPIDRFGDKFAHMLAFASLAAVAALAWRSTSAWVIALRLSAFGAAIELIQAVPVLHRDSDWRDWAADSMAIALAMLATQFLVRFLPPGETT